MYENFTIDSNEDLDESMDNFIKDIDLGKAPSQMDQLFTDNSFPPNTISLVGSNDSNEKLAKRVSSWERIPNLEPKAQLFVNGVEPRVSF